MDRTTATVSLQLGRARPQAIIPAAAAGQRVRWLSLMPPLSDYYD
jgi:hypothetical protein